MKLTNLVPLAFLGLAFTASCSQGNLTPETNTGARGGASGAGQAASGGTGGTTGGTGGGTSSGGNGNLGGSTNAGAGGSSSGTGGTTGGSVSAGGMGASAGVGPTSGGTAGAGGGGGAGASAGGSGGMPAGGGTGGTDVGGSPSAGGMGAAGGGALDPATVVPGLDGWYWEISTTNGSNPGGNNYWLTDNGQTCPQNSDWAQAGVTREKTFKVMGTPGTKYTINFELRGAMGFRCYTGGTPTTMQPSTTAANNGWYVGGQQYNNSIWNTYELDVQNPPVTGEANTYFLNGIPSTSNTCDQELTYEMRYTAKFVVMGDSTLRFSTHDTNCKAQQNCGPTPTASCAPRQIDLSGMSPAATITQPVANAVGGSTYYPQWFYFDVKSVTSP
jgi:hypothetical protein